MRLLCLSAIGLLFLGCGKKEQKPVSYREDIQPILLKRCVSCHGGEGAAAKIDLTSYEAMTASRTLKGKKPLVIAERLPESWLYVLAATDQPHYRMPPDTSRLEPLPNEEVQLIGKWIMQGAKNN